MRRVAQIVLLGAAISVAVVQGVLAQTAATIGFGYVAARSGRSVTIPLSLRTQSGESVVRVVSRIQFPSARATFERLEPTALRDGDEAVDVTFEVKDVDPKTLASAKRDATSPPADRVLEVRVTNKQVGRPIGDGIMTFLVFRVAEGLPPEKVPEILLPHEATVVATAGGPVVAAEAEPGQILLETKDAPIVQCFFYMH